MKTSVVLMLAALAAGFTSEAATNRPRRVITPEHREELHQRVMMRRTGGVIREANSAKGAFVVLNAQKRIATDTLKGVQKQMDGYLAIQSAIRDAEGLTVANIAEKIKGAGGTVGAGIVEDDTLPTLTVAPETGWTLINVRKLAEKCPDEVVLAARVRKEIMRSLAFVTGCAYMTMADPLMRDVVKPGDLDALPSEELGIEILNRFGSSAPRYGLKPWHVATYRQACQEGWAPQPTNEFQKAIWDKAHEVPTKPIKIEYNEKRDKGK